MYKNITTNKISTLKALLALMLAFSFTSFSYAQKEEFAKVDNEANYFSFVRQIKDILNIDQKDKELKDIIKPEGAKKEKDATVVILATSSQVIAGTTTPTICEAQVKVNQKKEKISKQIKSQIKDKNKLIESLLVVSASSSENFKKVIDEKILKLDEGVSEIIKSQKNLLDTISSSTENVCDNMNIGSASIKSVAPKKEMRIVAGTSTEDQLNLNEENKVKIKKIENNIAKKSSEVNTLIKVDIKKILESIQD